MTQKNHNATPKKQPHLAAGHDLTVVLSGENPLRASLRDGQLECPADFALRAYLAAALVQFAQHLTAKGTR